MYDGDNPKKIYNVKNPPSEGNWKNWVGENRIRITVAINIELSFRNSDLNSNSPPQINISPIFTCVFMLGHIKNLSWPLFNSLKAQFFHPLSTNLLYWAHTPTLLGLGYKLWPYIYIYIYLKLIPRRIIFWSKLTT